MTYPTRKMRPFLSSPHLSLLPLSLSLSLLLTFFHATAAQTLIHDTCKTCSRDDPNVKLGFCTAALQAAPASGCASLRGLGKISVRLVRYNLTDTRCHIKQLLKKGRFDPYVKQCLNDCLEMYSDAIPSIKKAMTSFNSRRFHDANIEISAVMDAATTCEDGFGERKGVVSPLTKRNNDTFQLSAIVLSIMNMLQPGKN